MLGEAAEVDAREDELYGDARGDELPAEVIDRRSRLERLRRCREELEAEQAKAEAAYQENLRWRAEWEAEHGHKITGRKPFPPDPDGLGKRTINVTDRDSRVIARETRQPVQGYNAQAVANEKADHSRRRYHAAVQRLRPASADDPTGSRDARCGRLPRPIGTVLADGGYWNNAHIVALGHEGMQVIVPTRSATKRRPGSCPPSRVLRLSGSTGS